MVHHFRYDHFHHALVMDRLEDSNLLAYGYANGYADGYANGLTMLNLNDYVMESRERSKRVAGSKHLVLMNRMVSIRFVELMSMVVGHHHFEKVMAQVLVVNVLNECVAELEIQNLAPQTVLLVVAQRMAFAQTLDSAVCKWEPMAQLVLVGKKLVVVAMGLGKPVAGLAAGKLSLDNLHCTNVPQHFPELLHRLGQLAVYKFGQENWNTVYVEYN